jgi:hypothetical protein
MPTIIRIRGLKVIMWPGDHIPPHFHVIGQAYAARVLLDGPAVLEEKGRRPAGFADVLKWAFANKELLEKTWARLTGGGSHEG